MLRKTEVLLSRQDLVLLSPSACVDIGTALSEIPLNPPENEEKCHINANKFTKCLVEFLNSKGFNGDKRSFCLSWLVIAVKYDIPLTQNEKNEIDNELENGSFPVKVINPMKPW